MAGIKMHEDQDREDGGTRGAATSSAVLLRPPFLLPLPGAWDLATVLSGDASLYWHRCFCLSHSSSLRQCMSAPTHVGCSRSLPLLAPVPCARLPT